MPFLSRVYNNSCFCTYVYRMVANFQGAQSFEENIFADEVFQLAMPTYHHIFFVVADSWLQQHLVLLPRYLIAAFWSGMNLAYKPLFTRLRIMRLTFSLD